MLTAKNARIMFNIFHKNNLNFQRKYILDMIEREVTASGRDYVVIDEIFHHLKLDETDWKFFEDLGYEVTPAKLTYYQGDDNQLFQKSSFGIIRW